MATKRQTAQAFVNGKSAKCHNAKTDGESYTLHRSIIASRNLGTVTFNWCGFYTRTTAAHMDEILRELGSPRRVSYAQARDKQETGFIAQHSEA